MTKLNILKDNVSCQKFGQIFKLYVSSLLHANVPCVDSKIISNIF